MAKVTETVKDKDGLVWRAKLQISQSNSRRNIECILECPIQKLVVLVKKNS